MKQTKIIIATMVLALSIILTSVCSINVMTESKEKNVTQNNSEIKISINNVPLTQNPINTATNLPEDMKTMDDSKGIVMEPNSSVKTTKKKAKKKKAKKTKKKKKSKYKYVGTFKVTGYCACASCNGNSSGLTACGTRASAGRTIAADSSKFSFGTKLKFNGHTYTVEDTGGAIKGNRIDLFFSSHSEALSWGVRYRKVYVKR